MQGIIGIVLVLVRLVQNAEITVLQKFFFYGLSNFIFNVYLFQTVFYYNFIVLDIYVYLFIHFYKPVQCRFLFSLPRMF